MTARSAEPLCVAWSEGGLAIGLGAGVVVCAGEEPTYVATPGPRPLTCLALSGDGDRVVAAGYGKTRCSSAARPARRSSWSGRGSAVRGTSI